VASGNLGCEVEKKLFLKRSAAITALVADIHNTKTERKDLGAKLIVYKTPFIVYNHAS